MKPVLLGYRNWAHRIFVELPQNWAYFEEKLESIPQTVPLVFLVGWSDLVPPEFYRDRTVLVLHPSPLPRYRGGSPIQHQIINGERASAVSIFRLDEEHGLIDSGPLCFQQAFALRGSLDDVFDRIVSIAAPAIRHLIEDFESAEGIAYWPQEPLLLNQPNPYEREFQKPSGSWLRRKPDDGGFPYGHGRTLEEIDRHVSALTSGRELYPPAYLFDNVGGRLELLRTRYVPPANVIAASVSAITEEAPR